jgi:hypothetical protein
MNGRVSLQPRHLTNALPPDERVAVEALERHLWHRGQRSEPTFEVLEDGVGTFLAISHMQECLRLVRSHKTGEDFAAEVLNTILPGLGLIEDTGRVRKPGGSGGRRHQPDRLHSRWWRIFRLPTLTKLLKPRSGAYPSSPGLPLRLTPALVPASLVGLLRRQGRIPARSKRNRFAPGSVQAAFHATGPP